MKVARSVSLDVEILSLIAESAEQDRRSVSQWIEDACREKLSTARLREEPNRRNVTYPKPNRNKR